MADMQVTIGIGRAVMEDEFLLSLAVFAQTGKEIHLLPCSKNFGFFLRQSGPHGKFGLGQKNGGFHILGHDPVSPVSS